MSFCPFIKYSYMYLIDMFCLGGYLGFHERAKELSVGGVGGATQLSPEQKPIIWKSKYIISLYKSKP